MITTSWHQHPQCWSVEAKALLAHHHVTATEYTATAFEREPPLSECMRAERKAISLVEKLIANNGVMPEGEA